MQAEDCSKPKFNGVSHMRVIVTGGAGYIGSHVALTLLQQGYDIRIIDDFSTGSPDIADCLKSLTGKTCEVSALDIRDTARLTADLHQFAPDAVIHLAGLKDVSRSLLQPLAYYSVNVAGTLSLLQAMDAVGCRSLVFSSSAAVYGEPSTLPIDECHPLNPSTPYGKTKACVESMIAAWTDCGDARRALSLRYFNPSGCHIAGPFGGGLALSSEGLMARLVAVAARREAVLEVYGHDYDTPDRTSVRDFLHVEDLAEAHVAALAALRQQRSGHMPVNIGSGAAVSVLEVIRAFEQETGQSIPYRFAPRRAGDIAASQSNIARATALLDWTARRNLAAMCKTSWMAGQNLSARSGVIKAGQRSEKGMEYSTDT